MEDGSKNRYTRRRRERTAVIVIVAFAWIAAAALLIYGIQFLSRHRAEERLAQLAENTWSNADEKKDTDDESDTASPQPEDEKEPEKDPLEALREMGVPIPDKEVDFEALKEETNADIYAWIYIPDSSIDYPVLQHESDNSYYLNYNLDGSRGYPGCIYTEYYNSKDFTDPNTVVYGHNMKNGTMFAGLHKFEDSEFFEEHPYVYIYTEEGLLVYEIFAAYVSGDEHILYSVDFADNIKYRRYLSDIFEIRSMNTNLREDVTVTEENRILTLSTCISNKPDNRYLVQGVLLNEN